MAAFNEIYKQNNQQISVSVQLTILNDDHTEPFISVTEQRSGQILSQTFNFLDYIGGKNAINTESKYTKGI
jgi:hypothetical protein